MKKKKMMFEVINDLILCMVAFLCIYPFLYEVFVAISDGRYLAAGQVAFFPKGVNLEVFKYVLTNPKLDIVLGMRNSLLYTVGGTAAGVVVTYITAYALSRPQVKGRYVIMALFTLTWVFEAGIIPNYIILSKFGFIDNPLVMIIPGAINTQYLIICKTYMEGLPYELEEAATVDGANAFRILWNVYVPISKPIIATIGTFYAVNIWNQYLNPQIYLKSSNLKVIQQILSDVVISTTSSGEMMQTVMKNGISINQYNMKAAAVVIAMAPIVCVYPFVQKYFKQGILIGSVKG
ncbi:MAG TPA: carbohydrate ABC transporter permease [Candidatus Eisenbergiella merdavium]|uniref:Carbohydrate ABC transporter permease n=1 Tax=Candidatus Eisenbergiella merdavium TaxID=2838551 RepID=A0A9D2NE43_9FIRM|nr:carbohydrate ABC transporter permease [Candidatus Eisenbergiella merdavium]